MVYYWDRGIVMPFVRRFWKLIILAFVGIFLFTQFITLLRATDAASTGFLSPTAKDGHHDEWSNADRAFSSNDEYSTEDSEDKLQSFENFNFSIPADSTINGIEVKVEGKSVDTAGCQVEVRLWSDSDNEYTDWRTQEFNGADTTYTLGTVSDLWGSSWLASDFSNANFHADVQFDDVSGSSCNNSTISLDHISLGVDYTEPLKADLTVVKDDNVNGSVLAGGSFVWTLTITNNGQAPAVFSNGQDVLKDNLPDSDEASYTPTSNLPVLLANGTTGNLDCDIDNGDDLDCEANGTFTIPAGGSFSVGVNVTPKVLGQLQNPRSGEDKKCKVDPEKKISESNEENNSCSDTVTVSTALNPELSNSCGLDVALVIDNSDSIDNAELTTMKAAMVAFTSAFAGTPTHFSVTKFGTTATVAQSFTSNLTDVNSAINGISAGAGFTNWEDGLLKAQSTYDPRGDVPNMVVFASDGNPNRVDNGTSVSEDQAVFEAAIVANALKGTQLAHIKALGIGNNLDVSNLEAISGVGQVITSNFDNLATTLAALADDMCGGTITTHKVIDADGNLQTTQDQTLGADWQFDVGGSPSNPDPASTNQNGMTAAVEVDPGTYSVTETVKQGFQVLSSNCVINDETNVSGQGNTVSGLQIGANDKVVCTFINTPHTPEVTLVANKIVCDDESDLPNAGGRQFSPITATEAQDWLTQNSGNGCFLAEDWSFEYKIQGDQSNPGGGTYGPAGGDWQTFTANGTTASVNIPLANVSLIQTREVLQNGFIPFSDAQGDGNNVSAEFYCANDAGNYDNWEWIQGLQDGATYYCVGWNVPKPFNIHAVKVVCQDELDLPNWGDGGPAVTGATAQQFVTDSQGKCQLNPDWQFQWAPNTTNPGDQTEVAGSPWSAPLSGSISLPASSLAGGDKIWVREVFDSNYVPFTGANTTQDVSAELYCGNDVLNYDNFDFIPNPQPEGNYYCVAWNVLKPVTLSATKIECVDEEYLPNWGDGNSNGAPSVMTATTASDFLEAVNPEEGDPVCKIVPWTFQWNTSDSADPDDGAGDLAGWNDFSTPAKVWLGESGNNIRVREQFNESYIPFTGQNTEEDVSAEIYCYNDVLHYDNWEWLDNLQPGETYHCVAWNVPINGQIAGLVYNDQNNNQTKQSEEPAIADATVWLLTHNSPWTLEKVTTTNGLGEYLFQNLSVPGTYYVCQDVESGWFQTQLNNAGLGGIDVGSALPGDLIGSDPDPALDALIAQFCYEVELTTEQTTSENNDFGNFQQGGPGVLGSSTTRDTGGGTGEGQVLAASTLAATGQPILTALIFGGFAIVTTLTLVIVSKRTKV